MRRFGILGLIGPICVLTAACSQDLYLAWPELEGMSSAVLVTEGPTQLVAEVAGGVLRFQESTQAELFVYEESLEALGLAPGANDPGVECRSCLLAAPDATYQLEPGFDGPPEALKEVTAPEPWALEILVPGHAARCLRCPAIESQRAEVPVNGADIRIRVLPWTVGEAVLHAHPDFVLWTVSHEAGVSELCRSDRFRISGASFRDQAGMIWFAITDGRMLGLDGARIVRGQPCEVATATITTPHPGQMRDLLWVAGGMTPEGIEIYGITADGAIVHHRRGAWSLIDARIPEIDRSQRIDWLGPGEALALSGRNALYVVSEETQLSVDMLLDPRGIEINMEAMTVRSLPAVGTVIGTRDDLVWGWSEGRAFPLDPELEGLSYDRVESMDGDGEGVVFTVRNGGIRWWYPDVGYCPRQDLRVDDSFKSIAPIGSRRWALGGQQLLLVRPEPEVRRCE